MSKTAKILSVSHHQNVLVSRNLVLQSAGHAVVATTKHDEAVELAKQQNFDLLVLGHSIPQHERLALASEIREIQPGIRILMLYKDSENPNELKRSGLAHETVSAFEGPEALLQGVQNALE